MMKLYTKVVTFRSFLNRLLRMPKSVKIERTETGLVVETQKYANKTIIKVY
jgi:hypothetical protein